jgi:hypothetical protein
MASKPSLEVVSSQPGTDIPTLRRAIIGVPCPSVSAQGHPAQQPLLGKAK